MKLLTNRHGPGCYHLNYGAAQNRESHVQSGSVVQVIGNFVQPTVPDVLQAQPGVDGDEFPLQDGSALRCRRSLELTVSSTNADDGFKAYRVQGLPITLTAPSHDEAVGALFDLVPVLWQEYALESDANLTPKAQALKALLLRDFAVID